MSIGLYIRRALEYILYGQPTKFITCNVNVLSRGETLKGKKIVITGSSRGLGLAMAKKFICEGASVLISGRDEHSLKKISQEFNCKYLPINVTDTNSFRTFLNTADEILGGVNCLVNNAGVSMHEGSIRNVSQEQFDLQFNTNLKGSYFLAKEFINLLESKGRKGDILFISSEMGFLSDNLPYGLTKAAINSFIQGLAYEVIKSGIRVNGIAPGVTASDMTGYKIENNLFLSTNMNDRVYIPEEVAEVASFLLSDISLCISGQIIVCDEGKIINFRR